MEKSPLMFSRSTSTYFRILDRPQSIATLVIFDRKRCAFRAIWIMYCWAKYLRRKIAVRLEENLRLRLGVGTAEVRAGLKLKAFDCAYGRLAKKHAAPSMWILPNRVRNLCTDYGNFARWLLGIVIEDIFRINICAFWTFLNCFPYLTLVDHNKRKETVLRDKINAYERWKRVNGYNYFGPEIVTRLRGKMSRTQLCSALLHGKLCMARDWAVSSCDGQWAEVKG